MKRILGIVLVLLLVCPSLADAYNFASGSYTGNGADDRDIVISATTSPSITDFQPDMCIVKTSGQHGRIRIASMPAGQSSQFASQVFDSDQIQALTSTGFQVGTSAHANGSGVTYYYLCIGNSSS